MVGICRLKIWDQLGKMRKQVAFDRRANYLAIADSVIAKDPSVRFGIVPMPIGKVV